MCTNASALSCYLCFRGGLFLISARKEHSTRNTLPWPILHPQCHSVAVTVDHTMHDTIVGVDATRACGVSSSLVEPPGPASLSRMSGRCCSPTGQLRPRCRLGVCKSKRSKYSTFLYLTERAARRRPPREIS